ERCAGGNIDVCRSDSDVGRGNRTFEIGQTPGRYNDRRACRNVAKREAGAGGGLHRTCRDRSVERDRPARGDRVERKDGASVEIVGTARAVNIDALPMKTRPSDAVLTEPRITSPATSARNR